MRAPGVIIVYAVTVVRHDCGGPASNRLGIETNFIETLTSNQAGLPAELKHINKRRKRN